MIIKIEQAIFLAVITTIILGYIIARVVFNWYKWHSNAAMDRLVCRAALTYLEDKGLLDDFAGYYITGFEEGKESEKVERDAEIDAEQGEDKNPHVADRQG